MKQIRFIAMLAVAALMAFSCKEPVDPDALTMGQATIEVPAEGGSQTITFTTNAAWTVGCDKNFVSFDQTSGEAGTVNVKVTFAPNDGYDARDAKIEVIAGAEGALNTTFIVKQAGKELVGMEIVYNLTYKPQTFEFTVNSTKDVKVEIVEGKDWISRVESKAAPVSEKLVFAVADNTDQPKRTGKIAVTIGEDVYSLIVNQANNFVYTDACTVKYVGNADAVYDNENWRYNVIKQYCITLTNADAQAVVVLSADIEGNPLEALPVGEFTTDEAGTRNAGTCHVKVNDVEEFYTYIVEDGNVKVAVEAEAEIAKNGDKYEISLVAKDSNGSTYRYKYEGTVAEITADLCHPDRVMSNASGTGYYSTYFTTKAQQYYIELFLSGDCENCTPYYSYVSCTFYGPESQNPDELPTGTFTIASKGTDSSVPYASGKSLYEAGDASSIGISKCFLDESGKSKYNGSATTMEGTTLTISKDEAGNYIFAINGKFTFGYNDADGNYVESDPEDVSFTTNSAVALEVANTAAPVVLDGDGELKSVSMGYVGYWYGQDVCTPGSHIFYVGWNAAFDDAYKVEFTLNAKADWTYVKNYSNRFCNTPVPAGTYYFSLDKDENCILNVKEKTRKSKVTNTYTGTVFYVRGGSVTFTNNDVTFDLDAATLNADGTYGEPVHFTGTVATTCMYIQDYSAKTAPTWNEAEKETGYIITK